MGPPWLIVLIVVFKTQLAAVMRRIVPDKQRLRESDELHVEIRDHLADIKARVERMDGRQLETDRKIAGVQTTLGLAVTDAMDDPDAAGDVDDVLDDPLPPPVYFAPPTRRGMGGGYK